MFAYKAERTFTQIYGTQVSLLEFLAQSPEKTYPITQIVPFHLEHQQKVGNTNYLLKDFIGFLLAFEVLEQTGPETAPEYRITKHGLEFLSYIKANYPVRWGERLY